MTLVKAAAKGDLLQVKEVLANSLPGHKKPIFRQVCQDLLFSGEADRSPQVLESHPVEFRHSFKPGFLLVLSEYSKSPWSPSMCLLVTTNGKQSGTGLQASSDLLTHQETCLPASPLPKQQLDTAHLQQGRKHPAPLYHGKLWVHAKAAV